MGAVQRRGLEPDQEQIAKSRFCGIFAPLRTRGRRWVARLWRTCIRRYAIARWPGYSRARSRGSFDMSGEIGRDGFPPIFSSMVGALEYGGA